MKAYSRRVRILLVVLGGLLLTGGGLFSVQADGLPYGRFWRQALGGSLGLALGVFIIFIRYHFLAARLVGARLFRLPVEAIPKKPGHTYVGEGFAWETAHSKLLLDVSKAGIDLPQEKKDQIAGDWLIHGVGANRFGPLFLPDTLLNQHVFLMGAPGSGKTRGLELLIEQAVARGDAVVVIDPKGDEGLLDRTYDSALQHGRKDDMRVLALPYPYRSARYNPVADYVVPSDVADRIAAILPKRGSSEAFRNFAWEFTSIVASALDIAGEEISLAKLENYCIHNTWMLVRRLIEKLCPDVTVHPEITDTLDEYREYCRSESKSFPELDALIDMASIDREYFAKISGSLRTILSKLSSRSIGYLLCPGDVERPGDAPETEEVPVLTWRGIDTEHLIVYFYLGSLIAPDSANATARMALADLMSYVGRKYAYEDASDFSKSRLTVIVDEVADAIAPESVNLLNKARGAGLSMVMAGQSLSDLEVALGSEADAHRALANMGTFLTLRAANPDDASYFSEKVGARPVPLVTEGESYEPALFQSGRSNIGDFAYRSTTSLSTRNDYLLPKYVLDRLARFHFFMLWAGGVYKGVLPLLDKPTHLLSTTLKGTAPPPEEEKRDGPQMAARSPSTRRMAA